jgi:APA family basic amino acid/polyamine antiporter
MTTLRRTLGLAECVFFGVGSILGAGIYSIIGKAATFGGMMLWLSFLFGAVVAFLTALSYAELSSLFPHAGGEYVYIREALGKRAGIIGGIIISFTGIVTGATVSLGFAGYFVELLNVPILVASSGIILLIVLINIVGIRESSTINIIFTVIEISGLLFVIYAAFSNYSEIDYFVLPPAGFRGIAIATALVFFSYTGFEEIVKLAEETHEPQTNIPRALMLASGIVVIVYLLVSVSVVAVLPIEKLSASSGPLAEVVRLRFGRSGALVISIIALFATSNTVLSNILGSSRVILKMAAAKGHFRILAYLSPRFRSPVVALGLIALMMMGFSLIGDIRIVALITTFFIYATFILVNLSVIILRKTKTSLSQPFRIPVNIAGIPVPSMLAILLTLILLGFSIYGLDKI